MTRVSPQNSPSATGPPADQSTEFISFVGTAYGLSSSTTELGGHTGVVSCDCLRAARICIIMLDCSVLPQKTDPQWLTARLTAMAQVVAPQTDSDLRGLLRSTEL